MGCYILLDHGRLLWLGVPDFVTIPVNILFDQYSLAAFCQMFMCINLMQMPDDPISKKAGFSQNK
jgi:hypothetical protein